MVMEMAERWSVPPWIIDDEITGLWLHRFLAWREMEQLKAEKDSKSKGKR